MHFPDSKPEMWTAKSNYNKNGQMVYTSTPYTPIDLSDGDDDDLCVWDYTYDSDGEPVVKNPRRKNKREDKHKTKASPSSKTKEGSSSNQESKQDHGKTATSRQGLLPREGDEPLDRQKVDKDLVAAAKNLTMLTQYVLKLEVRVGKTTKEAIRQTLDDTAALAAIELLEDKLPQEDILSHIVRLSEQTARRMYLVDRYWRRQFPRKPEGEGEGEVQASHVSPLLGEAMVKDWINIEKEDSPIMRKNPCYFTVRDLASGRKFRDWTIFLKESCGFKDNAEDERKLLNLAWRFLDRELRGELPSSFTDLEAFVDDLEHRFNNGKFERALEDPEKQEKVDQDLWRRIRRLWSARTRPQ